MDTVLSYAVECCAVLLGLSAFFDKWAALSQRPIFQGRPLVNTAFLGETRFKVIYFFLLTGLSFFLQKCDSDRSHRERIIQIAQRDSTNRAHTDSSIAAAKDTLIDRINKKLLPHELKYDVNQNKIEPLTELPGLDISTSSNSGSVKRDVDSLYYDIVVKNTGNCTIRISFNIYIASLNDNFLECQETSLGLEKYTLSQGIPAIKFPLKLHFKKLPEYVYILILGSFSPEQNSKPNLIDKLLEWDIEKNEVGWPISISHKNDIESKIKRALHL